MLSAKWLIATAFIAGTTVACTEQYGYPNSSYNSGYRYSGSPNYASGYNNNGSRYYNNAPNYSYGTPRRGPNGDYDRDGVPNRYDRDANGDGLPDRYQR